MAARAAREPSPSHHRPASPSLSHTHQATRSAVESGLPPDAQQNATIDIEIWERIALVLIVNSTADAAAMASELEAGPLCNGTDTCTVVYQAGTRRLSANHAEFAANPPSSARRLAEQADYVATRTYAEDAVVRPPLLL